MRTETIQAILDRVPPSPRMEAAQASIPLLGESCFALRIGAREGDVTPTNEGETKSLAREWRTATRKVGGRTMSADTLGDAKDSRVAELASRWAKLVGDRPHLLEGDDDGVGSLVLDGEDYSHLNPQTDGDGRYAELRMGKLSNAPQNNYGGSRDVGDGV